MRLRRGTKLIKKKLQKRLIECNSELQNISRNLQEIREMDLSNDFEGYKESTLEIARKAEHFACKIRGLVSETILIDKSSLMLDVSEAQGITIDLEESWLKIVMPFLLPKKKFTHSCSFIIDPLSQAIRYFKAKHNIERFDRCVICFRNIYTIDGKEIRDHDNIEKKKVLDAIGSFLLVDDSGMLCSNFYTSKIGNSEATEIYLVPQNDFEKWLKFYPM